MPSRAELYDRHIGRYAGELAAAFARFAQVGPGMRALDVGCGPGALAGELAARLGGERVVALDPSPDYVEAVAQRVPGVHAHVGVAEELPFEDGSFDAVLAQLVVQIMDDPVRAVGEMRRVTVAGGIVATCVWDFRDRMPLLGAYWGAAAEVDPEGAAREGSDLQNEWCTRDGLRRLWRAAGLEAAESVELSATANYRDLDDAWSSIAETPNPSGVYCRSLDEDQRAAMRVRFDERLASPEGPFRLTAHAWAIRGRAPDV